MRRATALILASLFTAPLQAQQLVPVQQKANAAAISPGQQGANTTEQAPASSCKQPCCCLDRNAVAE
jgi:hypothetical protein